ncbi:hypothetical protein RND81_05G254200 [Saponaria officinalis]|uniref:GIR1-like zinc ribbon domain-containing protein n=1 Tax=Saponaria officinalis TaxID=3572 RepID=A0AAW1L0S8_SAPOF
MFARNKRGPTPSVINPQELDLKLNLSPPRRPARAPPAIVVGPRRMSRTSPEVSPPRSCVSSEDNLKYSSSPETTSMVLAGCPRCLMYVMVPASDTLCPKCKSPVLLDFHHQNNGNGGGGGEN